jgi:DNA-binding response OmpR family regulator
VLDTEGRFACRDSQPVVLTKGQFDLLLTLIESEGRVVSFEDLESFTVPIGVCHSVRAMDGALKTGAP